MGKNDNKNANNNNEVLLPIDIHYDKLVDWLVDRKKTTLKWSLSLTTLRESIKQQLSGLPLSMKNKYSSIDPTVHYWHCLEVMNELLSASDNVQRTVFGNYQDSQLHEWSVIIREYERDNLCVAEGGRLMAQAVNFDIPSYKRLIQTSEKQLGDVGRKMGDCERGMKEFAREYDELCTAMNIQGVELRAEILQGVRELDSMLVQAERVGTADEVMSGLQYYREFVKYSLRVGFGNDEATATVAETLCTTLEGVANERQERDRTGEDFVHLEVDDVAHDSLANNGVVDVGDDDVDLISWDITLDSSGAVGVDMVASDDVVAVDSDAVVDIDWGISLDGGGEQSASVVELDMPIQAQPSTTIDFPVTSQLDNVKVRNDYLADLLELQSFLSERIHDMATSTFSMFTGVNVPRIIQTTTVDNIESMLKCVSLCVDTLNDSKLTRLLLIRSSSLYVDRLVSTLKQKTTSIERLKSTMKSLEERQSVLTQTVQRTTLKLRSTIDYVRVLQKHVELFLSKQYDGREVNIFGDINTI